MVWNGHSGGGEVAQLVGGFTALTEDQNVVPSTHTGELTINYSSNARESIDLFGRGYLHVCLCESTHMYIHTHTYTYKGHLVLRERMRLLFLDIYVFVCLFVFGLWSETQCLYLSF